MSASLTLNDSTKMPSTLAFGTGTALYGKSAEEQVIQALDAGFTHLDLAAMYQNEETVGNALKAWFAKGNKREDLYITTKVGGADARQSLAESLTKLGVDYVDLFLIHSPILTPAKTQWPVMEALKKEGLARSVGVSNFRISDLKEVEQVGTFPPSVNQIELHPYVMDTVEPLLAYMQQKDIKPAAYCPLSSLFRFTGGAVDPVVAKIAARLSVSEGNVLLRWALQRGQGEVVTTSSKLERCKEQLKVFDIELTEQEVKDIDTAGKTWHKRVFMEHMDDL